MQVIHHKTFFLGFIFVLMSIMAMGQNKKALTAYHEARMALQSEDYEECWKQIEKALKYDPNYFDALLFAGDFRMSEEKANEAIPYYERALMVKQQTFVKYRLAIAYRDNMQYSKGLRYAREYEMEAKIPEEKLIEIYLLIASLEFGEQAMKNPVPFEPIDLGGNINTVDGMEYFPSINARGDVLVYTSRTPEGQKQDEDFFASIYQNGAWQRGERLDGFLNSSDNEGAQSLSADGTELYFAGCQRMDGFGSCDIYVSLYRNGLWTKPQNLGTAVNTVNWESQPSISPDGKTLYFVRGKAGVNANTNIMYTVRQADGTWSKAEPIGAPINTPFADESPYIHFDNQTLYFTSDGHPGMGRKDLFYSKKQPNGTWGDPVNLGYPINTPNNEFSLVVGPDGKTGYFASDRINGGFNLDIYSFELPQSTSATAITWINGKVRDVETGKPVQSILEFYDLRGKIPFQQIETDAQGNFFAVMPVDRAFAVFINQKGYLPYSENFDLAGVDTASNYQVNIGLQPIKSGTMFTLKNILFDTDSYVLKEESFEELDRLVAFLTENAAIKAAIHGHTDNQGSAAHNKTLSENRAKAVVSYLVEKGIAANRLTSKGFGDTQPIADNETEKGRSLNRRTEVILQ
jgi:outer membrane protein OmpA-like peptidoglycan-associated protein